MKLKKWKPYPSILPPPREAIYLVTYRDMDGELGVTTDFYYDSETVRDYEGNVVIEAGWRFHENVTAWTELPEHYEGNGK